jgi:hypothetical protein
MTPCVLLASNCNLKDNSPDMVKLAAAFHIYLEGATSKNPNYNIDLIKQWSPAEGPITLSTGLLSD